MNLKGKIFKSQFCGDYWTVVDENNDKILIEATFFSGRPWPDTRDCSKEDTCPFPYCNFNRNQFCISKGYINGMKEITQMDYLVNWLKGKVIFRNTLKNEGGERRQGGERSLSDPFDYPK